MNSAARLQPKAERSAAARMRKPKQPKQLKNFAVQDLFCDRLGRMQLRTGLDLQPQHDIEEL